MPSPTIPRPVLIGPNDLQADDADNQDEITVKIDADIKPGDEKIVEREDMTARVNKLKFENVEMTKVTERLAADDLYKGVPGNTFFQQQGDIWKSKIGEFADSSSLAKSNDIERPLKGFISHSWRSPWWQKYLALLLHWYGIPAFALAVMIAGAGMYLVGPLGVLLYYMTFPIFLFAAPMVSSALSWAGLTIQQLFFFDRCCIVQSPLEKKLKGIYSLDQYLKTSESLVILFDEGYFTRTWCMFEVATYAYLLTEPRSFWQIAAEQFEDPWVRRISLVPVQAVPYFIGSYVWSFLCAAAMVAMGTDNPLVTMLNSQVSSRVASNTADAEMLFPPSLVALVVVTVMATAGILVATTLCVLKLCKTDLKKWTWDDAQCTVAADKDLVKGMIQELYAEEAKLAYDGESFEDGMDYFVKDVVNNRLAGKMRTAIIVMAVFSMMASTSPLVMILVAIIASAMK